MATQAPIDGPILGQTSAVAGPAVPAVVTAKPAIDNANAQIAHVNSLADAQAQQTTAVATQKAQQAATDATAAANPNNALTASKNLTATPPALGSQGNPIVTKAGNYNPATAALENPAPTTNSTPPAGTSNGSTPTSANGAPSVPDFASQASTNSNNAANATNENTKALTDGLNAYQTGVAQLQNGTFPLTPSQQAQLDEITQQFQNLINTQTIANNSNVGAAKEAGGRLGINASAPTQYLGTINAAVSEGVSKIATLNTQMNSAITTAQTAFQTNDMTLLNDTYTQIQNTVKAQQTAIDDIYNQSKDALAVAQQQYQDQATAAENAVKDAAAASAQAFSEKMQDANLTLAQKTQAYNQMNGDRTFTLDQKKEADAQYNAAASRAIQGATLALDQRKESFAEAQAADPLGLSTGTATDTTGQTKALVNAGVASTTVSGNYAYVDTSQFSTPALKAQAEKVARAAGIPIISSATEVAALQKIDTASQDLSTLLTSFKNIAPTDAGEKFSTWLTKNANMGLDTPQGQFITAYNDTVSLALPAVVQAAGGVNRINRAEISSGASALPTIDNKTDTLQDAVLKVQAMSNLLNNSQKSLLGGQMVATTLQGYLQANPTSVNQVQALVKQFPNATSDQILEAVQQ